MFSERLKKLRENKKFSQEFVAKQLKISRQGYAKYEKGTAQPHFESLKKLSLLFDVSIDYLVTGNEHTDSPDEMWQKFLDPDTQLFFKDLKEAPEEKMAELIKFWEFIKERDK